MTAHIINGVLASSVANNGTFTVNYPTNTNAGTFTGSVKHSLVINQNVYTAPTGFSVSFGASNITVTNSTGATLAADSAYILQLELIGARPFVDTESAFKPVASTEAKNILVSLGSPIAADADGVSESQSVTIATTPLAVINGALAADGVATLDGAAGRNVVAAWTNTAVITITGTDVYGKVVKESSASGTSFTGKKAFKTVTSVSLSANVTGLTVGTGNILGSPVFISGTGYVVRELMDGATPTAGTVVAGVTSAATATSGDVRGTYTPNSAPNASRSYQLVIVSPDAGYAGVPQFAA